MQLTHAPEFAVLSVMGPHAGESAEAIFKRKIIDIRNIGKTFWLIRSHKAKPDMVQAVCSAAAYGTTDVLCLFLGPSSPGGAIPTVSDSAATEYSADLSVWYSLPSGLSPVTGLITRGAYALVLDILETQESKAVDLWQFADFFYSKRPIIFRQGASTVCALRKDNESHQERMKSGIRKLFAVGRLTVPYAVWLR